MANGKILMSFLLGLCLTLAGVGIRTWAQADANSDKIAANGKRCMEHRKDTKEMPTQIAVIKADVEHIKVSLEKQDAKLEQILKKLD